MRNAGEREAQGGDVVFIRVRDGVLSCVFGGGDRCGKAKKASGTLPEKRVSMIERIKKVIGVAALLVFGATFSVALAYLDA